MRRFSHQRVAEKIVSILYIASGIAMLAIMVHNIAN